MTYIAHMIVECAVWVAIGYTLVCILICAWIQAKKGW